MRAIAAASSAEPDSARPDSASTALILSAAKSRGRGRRTPPSYVLNCGGRGSFIGPRQSMFLRGSSGVLKPVVYDVKWWYSRAASGLFVIPSPRSLCGAQYPINHRDQLQQVELLGADAEQLRYRSVGP